MASQIFNHISSLTSIINGNRPIPFRRTKWLKPHCDGLFWRLELSGATDVLVADALWDHASGSGRDIVETSTNRRELRLRRALEDHQRWRRQRDPIYDVWVEDAECFTDVIVCIPEAVWVQDFRSNNGERVANCAQTLEKKHKDAFKKSLPPGNTPRYLTRLDPTLAADHVAFLFGIGVYIPDDNEMPAFHILPALDGKPLDPPTLKLWTADSLVERQAGFYTNQKRLLFTPENQGPLAISGWRDRQGAYLQIRRVGENDWQADCDTGATTWHQRQVGGTWTFERKPITGDGQVLTLELKLASTALEQEQNSEKAAQDPGGTWISDHYPPMLPTYTLGLEAVGLPDLLTELRQWSLWLNAEGILATTKQIQRDPECLINLRLDQRGLWLSMPGASPQFLQDKITEPMDIGDTGAKLLPFAIPGQRGLIRFSHAVHYPLDAKSRSIGRTDHANANASPDICLDQLAQPGGLLWRNLDLHRDWTLANLGLSRQHARIRVEADCLLAEPVQPHCLMQPLDHDYKPKSSQKMENTEILSIDTNDCLLIANYILRFRKEERE